MPKTKNIIPKEQANKKFFAPYNPSKMFWKAFGKLSSDEYNIISFYGKNNQKFKTFQNKIIKKLSTRKIFYVEINANDFIDSGKINIGKFILNMREQLKNQAFILSENEQKDNRLKILQNNSYNADNEEFLPVLFADDVYNFLLSNPFVIFINSYDIFENYNVNWFYKFIKLLPNTLWVFMGNSYPQKVENISSYLLTTLSDYDADEFLKSNLILNKNLREDILKLSKGYTVYIDMAVKLYKDFCFKYEKMPNINDIGNNKKSLIEKYLNGLKANVFSMACYLGYMKEWTYEDIKNIIPDFDENIYCEEIINLPFITEKENKIFSIEKNVQIILADKLEKNTVNYAYFAQKFGKLKARTGDYLEAYNLQKSALDIFIRECGKKHQDTLTAMKDLAEFANILKQPQKALKLLKEIVENDNTIQNLKNLAYQYRIMDLEEDALNVYREILTIYESEDGNKKTDRVLEAMGEVADSLVILRRNEEAEKIKLEILSERQEELSALIKNPKVNENLERAFFLGDEIWSVLTFLSDDEENWWINNRKALDAKRLVVNLYRDKLGIENEKTLDVLDEWATTLMVASTNESWQELIEVRKEILSARLELCGEDDERTISAMTQLAEDLTEWADRPEEGKKIFEELLTIRRKMLRDIGSYYGYSDENTIKYREDIARILESLGRKKEAGAARKVNEIIGGDEL